MKRHASLNRCYRLVWNQIFGTWVAVAENVKGRGKSVAGCELIAAALALLTPLAYAAPNGGQVTAGAGTIARTGLSTTITQQSQKLAIDWNSFSIAANEAVRFNQPSAAAIALNRVLGPNGSQILGSLTANGQVFILNPNGVLFGRSAQVNVGGLVASTLSLSNANFNAGNYAFTTIGATGTVVNQGNLTAANGGYIALLGNSVSNQGVITATLGTALLTAGDKVTLTLNNGSLLGYSIDAGALNALAENRQLVRADGGLVVLSAKAADALSTAAVNNSGIVEARTMQNQGGVIKLLGGMQNGQVNLGGTLDASAPNGGNGGSVETSAATVNVASTASVTTAAPSGSVGSWLIDSGSATSIGFDISPAALGASLNRGNVTIQTATPWSNISVEAPVSWASANKLTLNAYNHIFIYAPISNAAGGSLLLRADQTGTGRGFIYFLGGNSVNLSGGGRADLYYNPWSYPASYNFAPFMGATPYAAWMLVNNVGQLQRMSLNLAGNYALGRNIDATATSTWNMNAGFAPVGDFLNLFTGQFDGLNHSITGLFISRPAQDLVGLFGATDTVSVVRNVGLVGGRVNGRWYVGGLVGSNGGNISNAYNTGGVSGVSRVGGLVGANDGSIGNASASGAVSADWILGGLAGTNFGAIFNASASGAVTGTTMTSNNIGGLAGVNGGSILGAHASGAVNGGTAVGGLAGRNEPAGKIADTYASGSVSGSDLVGGLVGVNERVGANYGRIARSYATGNVSGSLNNLGGLAGQNFGRIDTAYATGNVTGSPLSNNVGGLAGENGGSIGTTYATGAATGNSNVGGLAGYNDPLGSIATAYSAGAVNGSVNVGGLAGNNLGTVNSAYWDMQTSGQITGTGGGNVPGITGLSTAQMKNMASFAGWNIANTGGSNAVWRIYDGNTYPLLRNFLTLLTVTANPANKTYNGMAYSGGNGVTYSTAPNANLLGTLSYGGTSQGAVNAGSYTITPAGYYSNQLGYDISTVNGTLSVNPAALRVTANNTAKTYNGRPYSGGNGVTYSGFVNGETAAVLGGTLAYGGNSQGAVRPGSYAITPGGLSSGNYTIGYVNGTLTIKPWLTINPGLPINPLGLTLTSLMVTPRI